MALQLIVFAKAPLPGWAKTRLIPALGEVGAARLAACLLAQTLAAAQGAAAQLGPEVRLQLCGSHPPEHAAWSFVRIDSAFERTLQHEGDLGQRMAHAVAPALSRGDDVLLMGTDGVGLDVARIVEAATHLACHGAVLQPVVDGGYLMLGLRAHLHARHRAVFENMPWSTDQVARRTYARLAAMACTVHVLPVLRDIDGPQDLPYLRRPHRSALQPAKV